MKYTIVEAGEQSWLLGAQNKKYTSDSSLSSLPRSRRDNDSDCNVLAALAKIALAGLLLVGSFIGLYLLNQQLISTYGPLEDTMRITDSFDLVHRDVWRADERIERGAALNASLVRRVMVFHTRGPTCEQFRWCVQLMRDMQVASNVSTGADIPYNFLIGGDGQTYEARGWSHQSGVHDVPALAIDITLTVAFIGDFTDLAPSESQLRQAETLLGEAVQHGRLAPNYRAAGVRYAAEAEDNGEALFAELARRWRPQWDLVIRVD